VKFALVSHVLPPGWSGQAMVLYRLLSGLDADTYCLLSRESYDDAEGFSSKLPARYHRLRREFLTGGGLGRLREGVGVVPGLVARALEIARIARREGCEAIVACTGNLLDLPAGYLASRLLRVRYFPYLFDDYTEQWMGARKRWLARRLERPTLRGATRVIVPNEFMRDEVARRHGVEAAIVRNPCDLAAYEGLDAVEPDFGGGEIRVVYTGAVYEANFDAFKRLLEALGRLDAPARVHVHTAQSAAELAEAGIGGPIVVHPHAPIGETPRIQREAHVLFLPLALDSPYPHVIRTAAPGKMGEYLAAGRPILVHAPDDSFVAWYFREHDCGVVVSERDPAALARALADLVSDPERRSELASRARQRAEADFDVAQARAAFLATLRG
jgi:glycosyltransferase involved in cell wall biosynthesis